MKRIAFLLTLLLAVALPVSAQNNPYSIDDECYTWFQAADHSVDDFETDTFETAQQNLLETSLRKKDTKAQTLYYVEQLKRTSHQAQMIRNQNLGAWDSIEWNARIEEDRETAQRIAKATGYMQYYYYASELCQTYYFNTQQDVVAEAMLTSMMQEVRETEDEYAMWKVLIYLGKLYLRISDQRNTQKCFKEVARIFETTQDPTIRRQSMSIPYCELADTYPVGSDSARLYYRKAEQAALTKVDSLRVVYYKAQLAAWDDQLVDYRRYRDYCLSQAPLNNAVRAGKVCLTCIDNILEGNPTEQFSKDLRALYLRQQLTYISALASRRQQWQTASFVQNRFITRLQNDINFINSQRLEQMTAQYENNRLSADLAAASKKATRRSILVGVLLILLVAAVMFVIHRKKK